MLKKDIVKVGCVIQGDIRADIQRIIEIMVSKVDVVVLSTWDGENNIPKNKCHVILNKRPTNPGEFNRNLQRYSTARGLEYLERCGCTHVLKWRSDIIPLNLNVQLLVELSQKPGLIPLGGRIVSGGYRHLSVTPDWFSSFPDIFAFGSISLMQLLWSDYEIDYSKSINITSEMVDSLAIKVSSNGDQMFVHGFAYPTKIIFNPHAELYSIFKSRLQKIIKRSIHHQEVVLELFQIIGDQSLRCVWFPNKRCGAFRPLVRGGKIQWWSVKKKNVSQAVYSLNDLVKITESKSVINRFYSVKNGLEIIQQLLWYSSDKIKQRVRFACKQ
jgi:hypothetical protein